MSKERNPSPEDLEDRYKPMVTPVQCGERIGQSKTRIYAAIHDGEIRAVRFGNRFRIPEAEIQRLMRDGLRSMKGKKQDAAPIPATH